MSVWRSVYSSRSLIKSAVRILGLMGSKVAASKRVIRPSVAIPPLTYRSPSLTSSLTSFLSYSVSASTFKDVVLFRS